eukprot:366501-Chlamydomonas_euryale.AAC.43
MCAVLQYMLAAGGCNSRGRCNNQEGCRSCNWVGAVRGWAAVTTGRGSDREGTGMDEERRRGASACLSGAPQVRLWCASGPCQLHLTFILASS